MNCFKWTTQSRIQRPVHFIVELQTERYLDPSSRILIFLYNFEDGYWNVLICSVQYVLTIAILFFLIGCQRLWKINRDIKRFRSFQAIFEQRKVFWYISSKNYSICIFVTISYIYYLHLFESDFGLRMKNEIDSVSFVL